jgi:sugar lactone lactonase YvrE
MATSATQNATLSSLAKQEGIRVPTSLAPQQQSELFQLQSLDPSVFDAIKYLWDQIKDHANTPMQFIQEAKTGQDPIIEASAQSNRQSSRTLAVLPDGATGPEGLTVGPDGNLYVGTFGYNAQGEVGGNGQLYVFGPDGALIQQISVADSTSHLLGLAFQPYTGRLLVLDAGAGVVREVNPVDGSSRVFMTLATITAQPVPNGVAFDRDGNVYVADSTQGIVWTVGRDGGEGRIWAQDELLTTKLVPPFGANGIVFNHDFSAAFVTNTGNDTILRIPVQSSGQAGTVAVLTNSVNGADGITIDGEDNLWVSANQNDEIDVVDPSGKLVARLGDFGGVVDGTPLGLLFPATPAFDADHRFLYVTNLAIDLRVAGSPQAGFQQTVDSQWAAQVQHYTVSRLPAEVQLLPGYDAQ